LFDYDAEVLYESEKNAWCSSEASNGIGKTIPVEVWGFQEVEASRFHDSQQMKVVRSAYAAAAFTPQERSAVLISVKG
jgi:hypothetical protein